MILKEVKFLQAMIHDLKSHIKIIQSRINQINKKEEKDD